MDFADILASSIHDIKNSLGLILNNLDDLINNPANHLDNPRQAILLQHEAQRANTNLIQLLNLYRLGNEQLIVRIAEYNLCEFLEEVVADNQAVCHALGLELIYQCDPDLNGYFDPELIRGVLDSAIGNARRYAERRILLSAEREQNELVLRVEDDGTGFPEQLTRSLENGLEQASFAASVSLGRTRLGLYFASQITQLHKTANRVGRLSLKNCHNLPGGCFELWLP